MGTRSNIIVNYGSTKTIIYRHWDGYIENAGYDIASTLIHFPNPNEFVRELLNKREDASFTRNGQYIYELTSEIHGDIEFWYELTFPTHYFEHSGNNVIKFEVYERKFNTNPAIGWKTHCNVKLIPNDKINMNKELDFIYKAHLKMLTKAA